MPLEQLIIASHPPPEWAVVCELSGKVGSRGIDRRADIVAFNCWPSKRHVRLAFEVKRTRQDFMREIDDPKKREWLEMYFHQCYFVVAADIVRDSEVPEGWGLYVATKAGDKLIRKVAAKHREVEPLPEWLALSAIRAVTDGLHKEQTRHYAFEGEAITRSALDAKVDELTEARRRDIEKAWNDVRGLKQALTDKQQSLEAPLATLAHLAGDYRSFAHWKEAPKEITPQNVREWVETVRLTAIRQLMRQVGEAHQALGRLIDLAQKEGLDIGEVKNRGYRPEKEPLG